MGRVITALTQADLGDVLAAAPELGPLTRSDATPSGWVARDDGGVLVGAVVVVPSIASAIAPDGLPWRMWLPTAPDARPVAPPSSVNGSNPLTSTRVTS